MQWEQLSIVHHTMQTSTHTDSFTLTLYLSCIASIHRVSYLRELRRTIIAMIYSPHFKVKYSICFSLRLNTHINRLILPSCSPPLDDIDT